MTDRRSTGASRTRLASTDLDSTSRRIYSAWTRSQALRWARLCLSGTEEAARISRAPSRSRPSRGAADAHRPLQSHGSASSSADRFRPCAFLSLLDRFALSSRRKRRPLVRIPLALGLIPAVSCAMAAALPPGVTIIVPTFVDTLVYPVRTHQPSRPDPSARCRPRSAANAGRHALLDAELWRALLPMLVRRTMSSAADAAAPTPPSTGPRAARALTPGSSACSSSPRWSTGACSATLSIRRS